MNDQEQREQLAKELYAMTHSAYGLDSRNVLDFILAREKGLMEELKSLKTNLRDQDAFRANEVDTLTQQLSAAREAFDNLLVSAVHHLTPEMGNRLNALAEALTNPPQALETTVYICEYCGKVSDVKTCSCSTPQAQSTAGKEGDEKCLLITESNNAHEVTKGASHPPCREEYYFGVFLTRSNAPDKPIALFEYKDWAERWAYSSYKDYEIRLTGRPITNERKEG